MMTSKMMLKNQTSRVETIALKKNLGASESGRLLLERLQSAGECLTAARAIEALKQRRAVGQEESQKWDASDEDKLFAILRDLQKEHLMDRPNNRRDCRAMLKYCCSTDPNLASRILEETASPLAELSTEKLLKHLKERFNFLGSIYPDMRLRSTRYSVEFVESIYRALNVMTIHKIFVPGTEKGCDICVLAKCADWEVGRPSGLLQIARRLTVDSGRLALARMRAFAAQWHRGGRANVPRKVASVWGRIRRDTAKFHIWCGTVSGDDFQLHMEDRPVSFVWHRNSPCVDRGALPRLFWLATESPLAAFKPPAAVPLEEISENEEDFHYDDTDDDPSTSEDEGPYCI
eukprot:Gregarina_sp_Pseudo_9__811@NODE_1519_length_1527_cov_34_316532_g1407_i0_p1_GENE_NODE_1519_length_1527_cov_34_316532_g1407_i0NODE_1519_length_1527_cov_34_316532_g1407_i0_p1_ORF_typecomplete_len347_score33_17_NODE_1519_length_1527_cov_34_316532_g1407_i03451385